LFFTVAVLLLSAMDRYHIVSQFKQRERVVIIDPAGTYYLSPLLQFSEAKDLHVQQAELAKMAFLERNPKDFDNPDLLKLLFPNPIKEIEKGAILSDWSCRIAGFPATCFP
jgi:hypothetical protein